ncbi:biotin--[acetyl-CoA-carboxylase] ligase [Bombella saccharophila]|uniref:biotin--[biotin carboxyl-carrier protein] ligase n=1 Tax=Bombella saccharophila TaxID=2967338 RepID=A0ABT3W7J9_9PROT|nr:biotin--[acetyl-CoA-carboxylase] ligase [Bombella saccharophila]MCX5614295.1 biotin--[acetyl-CoA-carboxylase] ligase [Bombella saccharophila]
MTWRFEIYETLASTSDFCRERAEAGEKTGLAVLAQRQSAARGSRGRTWESGEGNLAFSFLFHAPETASFRSVLPYLAGLALYDGLVEAAALSPDECQQLHLKWPNDLLLNSHKMAGILIETGVVSATVCWVVIGIGVNLQKAPALTERKVVALSALKPPPAPQLCAESILRAFDKWWEKWQQDGDTALWDGWIERAHPLGTRLILERHGKRTSGRFAGLDVQGRLLLTQDDGTVTSVVTGDVICE